MPNPAEIIIPFDADKLAAIEQFSDEKDAPLVAELCEVAEKIYARRVPAPVRQYIEKRPVTEKRARKTPPREKKSTEDKE